MDNLSENKVVKTEEDYKSVHGDLVIWRIALAGEFITLGLLMLMAVTIHKTSSWSSSGTIVFLIEAGWFLVMFILGNITSMLHEVQSSTRRDIDDKFDSENVDYHLNGIVTSRGVRLAKRELRRYRRYKKSLEKEREQERQEHGNDCSGE